MGEEVGEKGGKGVEVGAGLKWRDESQEGGQKSGVQCQRREAAEIELVLAYLISLADHPDRLAHAEHEHARHDRAVDQRPGVVEQVRPDQRRRQQDR